MITDLALKKGCSPAINVLFNTDLYSMELLAEEVLRLRVFLLRRARPRQVTSPPSQVEQQYGAGSSLTSFPPSISDRQAASELWRASSFDRALVNI